MAIKTYEVKSGDTLSAIARKLGVPINQISGYRSGDPNLIYPGEKLTIGETVAPLSGLGGTLETGGGVAPTGQEKTLPTVPADNLSVFQNLLKQVSEKYSRAATMTGFGAATGILGVSPEAISGRSLAGIVDFVKGQAAPGISDVYQSAVDLLNTQQKQAQNQLQLAISTGAIANFSDEMLERLSSMSDMPLDYLQEIKIATKTKSEAKLTDAGRISQLNQFFKERIGEDGKVSAADYMAAYKEWIGLNGTISDFKYVYPVEEWLGEWEWKNLPSAWRPSTKITDIKSLPPEQQIFINQTQQAINDGDITYDEAVNKYLDIAVYLKPTF